MVKEHLETLISFGWTQGRIARETGLKQPNIHRILAGKQKDVLYEQGKRLEALAHLVKSERGANVS